MSHETTPYSPEAIDGVMNELDNAPVDEAVLSDEEIVYLINHYAITEQDQLLISILAATDKNERISHYHNFFTGSSSKESLLYQIQTQLEIVQNSLAKANLQDDNNKIDRIKAIVRMHEATLVLLSHTDEYITNAIIRALEEYKPVPA